jgi:putative acetyltransferase
MSCAVCRESSKIFLDCLPKELSAVRDYLANLSNNEHQFVAVRKCDSGEEQIIGMIGLVVAANPRTRHCGSIGIMVHKDYQNQGVGSALMKTVMDLADNWLMLIRTELGVYTDNANAIHLYEKFGFKPEGIKRMAAVRNGEYVDELMMGRIRPEK